MRYVITGASGHIGNNLVRLINREQPDADILILTRRSSPRELDGARYREAVGNLFDVDFLRANIAAGDVVVHAAGLIDLTDKRAAETERVNVELTKRICDVSREQGVARFLYIGSVDGIKKAENDAIITEPTRYDPTAVAGHYGQSKAKAAAYVCEQMAQYPDFSAAIVLPSAVIGVHDHKPSAAGKIIRDTLRGKVELGIDGGYNFVDVIDVCRVIVRLAHGRERDSYIVCGEAVTVKELYERINRQTGARRRPIILPTWLVRLFLPLIPMLNKITLKALSEPHRYSCEKAQRELGFTPTPLDDTLRDTIAWFQES